jgi:hypothetical protein
LANFGFGTLDRQRELIMELTYGLGALVLGIAIAAALLYSRHRSWWQRATTDAATRDLYRKEENRRVAKGEP